MGDSKDSWQKPHLSPKGDCFTRVSKIIVTETTGKLKERRSYVSPHTVCKNNQYKIIYVDSDVQDLVSWDLLYTQNRIQQ